MRQVLFVTYYFPPLGGAGVQRALKFVKYLPQFGWEASVLTVRPPRGRLLDASLLEEIPASASVFRTAAPALPLWLPWRFRSLVARWLLPVDEQIGWLPPASRGGSQMLRAKRFDLLLSYVRALHQPSHRRSLERLHRAALDRRLSRPLDRKYLIRLPNPAAPEPSPPALSGR